jgi:cytochrome c peroxidase
LTEQEKEDILAFLHMLTDEEFITNPQFSNPFDHENN